MCIGIDCSNNLHNVGKFIGNDVFRNAENVIDSGFVGCNGNGIETVIVFVAGFLKTFCNFVGSANINKAIEAGLRQKARIEQFMKHAAFEELPEVLRETARLRAENPELSLTELGGLMQPPMSKAGVAHRLKKLEQLMGKAVK